MYLFIFIMFFNLSYAGEIDQLHEKLILTAKSKSDLDLKLKSVGQLKELGFKCDFELNLKKIPISCQKRLIILESLGAIKPKEKLKRLTILDHLCSEFAQNLNPTKFEPVNFGGKCQQVIDQKIKQKNYIVEEQSPW